MRFYSATLLVFFSFLICLPSCKEKPALIPIEEKQEIISLVNHEAFIVMVDNLRMRQTAGLKSEVVRKLAEGTIVLSDGITSDFSDRVTLRGKEYYEPYHKIYLKNDPDQVGWVYGGAIMKVYHDDNEYPFSSNLDGLATGLIRRKKETLDDGLEIITALAKDQASSPAWNDALFYLGTRMIGDLSKQQSFYKDFEKQVFTQEEYNAIFNHTFDYASRPIAQKVHRAGMQLKASEGSVYADLSDVQLGKWIGGPFSESVNDYIAIRKKEEAQRITSDAALVAPLQVVVDLLILQDAFVEKYTDYHPLMKRVLSDRENNYSLVLNGTSNTPAFTHGSGELDPEFQKGWEYFIQKHPDHSLVKAIKAKLTE